ncbi:MAG TPA: hypothetical protein VLD62_13240 [Acidimicrobiia bacterium]|nr:hypothetical protein [Acidimicrobiia bacterium]
MARYARALIAAALILGVTVAPAMAQDEGQEAVIDVEPFITRGENFVDMNGDGIPDLGELAEGFAGIWDDNVGAQTPEEFEALVTDRIPAFDTTGDDSVLVGACGGLAIAYDENGMSLDAIIDNGDSEPLIDVFTGEQAMTRDNPFRVDPNGVVAYWGFTRDNPNFSVAGRQEDVNYQEPAPAFHDHIWTVAVMGVSADRGGDPNQRDKNRNAGLVELFDIFGDIETGPLDVIQDFTELKATVKAKGAIIDLYNDNRLSTQEPEYLPDDFDQESIAGLAAGREYCFGEGWVEFVGDGPEVTADVIAGILGAAGFAGLLFNVRPAQSWRSSAPAPRATPRSRP